MRALETEVKELKDLLDEKDETIDVLSKLQSHDTLRGRSKSPKRVTQFEGEDSSCPSDNAKIEYPSEERASPQPRLYGHEKIPPQGEWSGKAIASMVLSENHFYEESVD